MILGKRLRLAAAAALIAGAPAGSAASPIRTLLGQQPVPETKGIERFQSGFLLVGHYFDNDRGAASARPDGTGTAYNLYELYVHDGVRGGKSGFLADVLFLSDREKNNLFNLSQLTYLLGLTFKSESLRLQFDREESIPLDRGGRSYRFWDVRGGMTFTSGRKKPLPGAVRSTKRGMGPEARGSLMVGYFLHNNSFPARSDLTGTAFLRYNARGEFGVKHGALFLVGEADFITQKHRSLHPVDLRMSLGVGARYRGFDMTVTRESWDVLDHPGFASCYLFAVKYPFGGP